MATEPFDPWNVDLEDWPRQENLKSIARALTDGLPEVPYKVAAVLAEDIARAGKERWTLWSERHPTPADAPIFGRDCLGYVHNATHLLKNKIEDGMWADYWAPMRSFVEQFPDQAPLVEKSDG